MGTAQHKMAKTLRMVSPPKVNFDPTKSDHMVAVKEQVLGFGGTLSELRFYESIEEIRQLILLDLYKETNSEKNDYRWFVNPGILARNSFNRAA